MMRPASTRARWSAAQPPSRLPLAPTSPRRLAPFPNRMVTTWPLGARAIALLKLPANCDFAKQRNAPTLCRVHHGIEPLGASRLQKYLSVDVAWSNPFRSTLHLFPMPHPDHGTIRRGTRCAAPCSWPACSSSIESLQNKCYCLGAVCEVSSLSTPIAQYLRTVQRDPNP